MIPIYVSITDSGQAQINWVTSETYSWVVVDNTHYGPLTDTNLTIDLPYRFTSIQVVAASNENYDYTQDLSDHNYVRSSIYVAFRSKVSENAQRYRILVDGTIEGYVEETGADIYTFITEPVSSQRDHLVEVEWQDEVGNWSDAENAYTLYMYTVPDGEDFTVCAVTAGTLRIAPANYSCPIFS